MGHLPLINLSPPVQFCPPPKLLLLQETCLSLWMGLGAQDCQWGIVETSLFFVLRKIRELRISREIQSYTFLTCQQKLGVNFSFGCGLDQQF